MLLHVFDACTFYGCLKLKKKTIIYLTFEVEIG